MRHVDHLGRLIACLLAAVALLCLSGPVQAAGHDVPTVQSSAVLFAFGLGVTDAALLIMVGTGGAAVYGLRRWYFSRVQSALTSLEKTCTEVSNRWRQLEQDDPGYHLTLHTSWLGKLCGESLKEYRKLITIARGLRVRLHALNLRIREARRLMGQNNNHPSIGTMRAALRQLKSLKLQLTVKLLPDEQPQEIAGRPAELANRISFLIGGLEECVKELRTALSTCASVTDELAAAAKSLSESFSAYTADGFAGEAYEKELSELKREHAAFLEAKESNPIGAARTAKDLLEQFEQLRLDLDEKVKCKRELESAVQEEIAQLEAKIAAVRSQTVIDNFPAQPGEVESTGGGEQESGETPEAEDFKLQEEGYNPDDFVTLARERTAEAIRLVLLAPRREDAAGGKARKGGRRNSKEAKSEPEYARWQRSAREAVTEGLELVDKILAAKDKIEVQITSFYQRQAQLAFELAECDPVRKELEASHLVSSWQAEAGTLLSADSLVLADAIAPVRTEYRSQSYMNGLQHLQELLSNLEVVRAALSKLDNRLKQLQKQRQRAKDNSETLHLRLHELAEKLERNRFSTCSQTAAAVTLLGEQGRALEATVALQITDWAAADKEAARIGNALADLGRKVDDQKSAYEKAIARLESLATVVSEAERATSGSGVRQLARTRYTDSRQSYKRLKAAMEVAGSNWEDLMSDMDEVKKVAKDATKLGTNDKDVHDRASRVLTQAQQKKKRLGSYTSGDDISEKMRIANSALAEAEARFEASGWEDAEHLATQADTSYRGALNALGW